MKKKVVIGMSGGVDSSVAAHLLKEAGFDLVGLFMHNWDEKDENCPSQKDWEDVLQVCEKLDIPCYSVNFVKDYWNEVFAKSLDEYRKGNTPNPDILCNREIKFKRFFAKAMELGADFLATGHYCRKKESNGKEYLARAIDSKKDQSYFLYTLKEKTLKKVLFPLGELPKPKVREIAKDLGLCNAEKKDSTGICFIGKRKFQDFIRGFIKEKPGEIRSLDGKLLGTHPGIYFYTIGQRKGLGIGGAGEAWFVVAKDPEKNIVYVQQGDQSASLFDKTLYLSELTWITGSPEKSFRCEAQIRYRSQAEACTVEVINENEAKVCFDRPQKAVTPKQAIVFYQKDICLGGGMIEKSLMPHHHTSNDNDLAYKVPQEKPQYSPLAPL